MWICRKTKHCQTCKYRECPKNKNSHLQEDRRPLCDKVADDIMFEQFGCPYGIKMKKSFL